MSNLTFDETLVRDHPAEPLEGHTMVVMERVGESGEKFYSLLEPGDDRPRRTMLEFLTGRPSAYFAFAVDASRHRLLSFSADVAMAEHAHELKLHFSLWYRVSDARLLVCTRASDPLTLLQTKVIEEVTDEISEQSWADVWHSFQTVSARVVATTLMPIKNFARDYGIAINSLRLKVDFSAEDIAREKELHGIREAARADRERADAAREKQTQEWIARQEDAALEEADRALTARQKRQDRAAEVATDAYVRRLELREQRQADREQAEAAREQQNRERIARLEDAALEDEVYAVTAGHERRVRIDKATTERQVGLLGEVGSAEELADTHAALEGTLSHMYAPARNGSNGNHSIRPRSPASQLIPAESGLSSVLADLLMHTEFRPDAQSRRMRGILLHVVAAAVADDSLSAELVDCARRARVEINAATNLPATRTEALLDLADPHQLRQRLYPEPVA